MTANIQIQDPESRRDQGGPGLTWRVLPPTLIILAGIALNFVSVSRSCSETEGGVETCTASTLVDDEGWGPLLILFSVPLIMSLIALVANRRWSTLASAIMASFFMLLGLASVGGILLPAVITAWLLVWRSFR